MKLFKPSDKPLSLITIVSFLKNINTYDLNPYAFHFAIVPIVLKSGRAISGSFFAYSEIVVRIMSPPNFS